MTKISALEQARGALAALASVEISKARVMLIQQGCDDDEIEVALAGLKTQLDEWRAKTLSDFKAWLDRPTNVIVGSLH